MNVFILTPVNFSIVPTLLQGLHHKRHLAGKKTEEFYLFSAFDKHVYQLSSHARWVCVVPKQTSFLFPITSTLLPWQQIHSSSCTVSLQEGIRLTPAHFKVISPHYACNYKDKIPPKMLFTQLARLSCHILLLICWTELQP